MPTGKTPKASRAIKKFNAQRALDLGRQTLTTEAAAVLALSAVLDESFAQAVYLILHSPGRLIVSGMGKSGHIARKIAATMASTGTPAYFVHPAEASHGDLGMIAQGDVLLALSHSGESEELIRILPILRRMGVKVISMTGNAASTLAAMSDLHLHASVKEEACPLNLAPTASTTVALALGDALAIALLDARGFGIEDFARSHPGGLLGRKLLTRVEDVMRRTNEWPIVQGDTPVTDAIVTMSKGRLGLVIIADEANHPLGIFTDGDLRRAFEQKIELRQKPIADVMRPNPHCIAPTKLAVEAVEMMERLKVNALVVCDVKGRVKGALNMHDLFAARIL